MIAMGWSPEGKKALGTRGLRPVIAFGLIAVSIIVLSGCNDNDRHCTACPEVELAAPRGLYAITGDEQVTLVWYANTETDLAGYAIYHSDTYYGTYSFVREVDACDGCYEEEVTLAVANGETYFYAVSAFDLQGRESELSYEEVSSTPRPQGTATITNQTTANATSGFDLSRGIVTAADDCRSDFYYVHDELGGLVFAGCLEPGMTMIQDMGTTGDDFSEITTAPESGWSPLSYVEAIPMHTYVLLTRDDHYAKIRITSLNADEMSFQWAYQTVINNTDLEFPLPE